METKKTSVFGFFIKISRGAMNSDEMKIFFDLIKIKTKKRGLASGASRGRSPLVYIQNDLEDLSALENMV